MNDVQKLEDTVDSPRILTSINRFEVLGADAGIIKVEYSQIFPDNIFSRLEREFKMHVDEKPNSYYAVDFRNVESCSTEGARGMINFDRRVKSEGYGPLYITNTSPEVRKVFENAKLNFLFEMCNDTEDFRKKIEERMKKYIK